MILVTGATGFLGMNLVQELVERGHRVCALDNAPFPQASRPLFAEAEANQVDFVLCDIRDVRALEGVLRKERPEVVIHAAAITVLGQQSEQRAREIVDVNGVATLNLLEASRDAGVSRFVYVSSSGIYGSCGNGVVPVHETAPYAPGTIYAVAKILSEMLVHQYSSFGHYRCVVARIGSPYGPWSMPTAARSGVSPVDKLVKLALSGEEARVFGSDCLRDWTHMRDIAAGLACLALEETTRLRHDTYNITSGMNVSINAVTQCLAELVPGFRVRFVDAQEAANVTAEMAHPRGPLDIGRIVEDCGFRPRYDIRSGLAHYVSWAKDFGLL